MNIEKRLQTWTEAGFISEEQRSRIVNFEQEQPSASWVLYGIVGLGVLVLLTGIISIIAANWKYIPDALQLGLYFALLGSLGFFVHRQLSIPGIVREALLTSFALLLLGGIGLIGQLYHLQGDSWQALSFWLCLVLPLCLFSESRLINNLWFLGFAITAFAWGVETKRFDDAKYFFSSLPLFFLGVGYGFAHLASPHFFAAARIWSYAFLLFPFAITANAAWGAEFQAFFSSHSNPPADLVFRSLPFLALLFSLTAVVFRKIQLQKNLSLAILFTLAASFFLIFPPLYAVHFESDLMGCVFFVLAWAGAAWIAASLKRKRLFDIATLVLGIRFIVVYFQVFGSLAATGIGLIISGTFILFVAWGWYKYRGRVAKVIQGSSAV